MSTKFNKVYDCFYSKITDDMYMELDEQQTKAMSCELLINALPWFEFPRVNIMDYDSEYQIFNVNLSQEEINIIATYMVVAWLDQQLASVELARMKYSGSDFKFTSQANHMAKLLTLKKDYERAGFHLQRLYKRRKADANGVMRSTFGSIMGTSVRKQNASSSGGSSCTCQDDDLTWEDFLVKDPEDNSWEDMGGNDEKVDESPLIGEGQWESM